MIPDRIRISQPAWPAGSVPVTVQARTAIAAPAARLGRTYQSLEAVLPPRVRTFNVVPAPSPHAQILHAQWTADYGGIEIKFFNSPASSSILVTAVTVTDPKWLKNLGVNIATSRFEIEKQLGAPLKSTGTTMTYEDEEGSDIGPSTLTLRFDGDRLIRASWTYPWD